MDLSLLKAIFKFLASPLNCFVLFSLFYLIIWLTRWDRLQQIARRLFYTSTCWLLLSSQYVFSNWLLHPLEYYYPIIKAEQNKWQDSQYIVVLGCYYYSVPAFPEASKWPECSLSRMMQARIMQNNKTIPIIVTGGYFLEDKTLAYADKARVFLQKTGAQNVIALSVGTNTEEELSEIAKQYDNAPIALVSSATHLRRAVAIAKDKGLRNVTPIPVNHLSPPVNKLLLNQPSINSVYHVERAIYEYFGLLYQSFKKN